MRSLFIIVIIIVILPWLMPKGADDHDQAQAERHIKRTNVIAHWSRSRCAPLNREEARACVQTNEKQCT